MKNAVKFNDHKVCEFLFKILDVLVSLWSETTTSRNLMKNAVKFNDHTVREFLFEILDVLVSL